MKILLVVVILATIYFIFTKRNSNQPQRPISPAPTAAVTASKPSPGSNYFKRPLDRTHEVLDQAKKNKAEF